MFDNHRTAETYCACDHSRSLAAAPHALESARGDYEARILSKSRYEPRLRATPRKRVVYEPRDALSSVVFGRRVEVNTKSLVWAAEFEPLRPTLTIEGRYRVFIVPVLSLLQ